MENDEGFSEEPYNFDEKVEFIKSKLMNSYTYWSLRKLAKEEIIKPKYKAADLPDQLPKIMKDLDIDIQFKNKITDLYNNMINLDSDNIL